MNTKEVVKNNRNLFSVTSLSNEAEILRPYATQYISKNKMSFIQLHPMYCNFDGYSEEVFNNFGFTPLYIEIAQRRVHEDYLKKIEIFPGVNCLIGECITLQRIEHNCTEVSHTMKDMFNAITEFHAVMGKMLAIFKHKDGSTTVAFKTPMFIRKFILSAPNLSGGEDIYHFIKTNKMKDGTQVKREVKTLLTHVNELPINDIFSKEKYTDLKNRIMLATSNITVDRICTIKFEETVPRNLGHCGLE